MCDLEYILSRKEETDYIMPTAAFHDNQRKLLRVPASNLKPTVPDYSAADTGWLSLIPDFFPSRISDPTNNPSLVFKKISSSLTG
jgi:hypothetical protein